MHLIHQQLIDLTFEDSPENVKLLEKFRMLYWEKILPIVDRVFTSLVPTNKVYRLEKLEIDLGKLGSNLSESDILFLVEKALYEQLEKILSSSPQAHQAFNSLPALVFTDPAEEKQEALFYFLKTGLLPWWYDNTITVRALFRQFFSTKPIAIITFLQKENSSLFYSRFVKQFSSLISLQELPQLSRSNQQYWQELNADVQHLFSKLLLTESLHKEAEEIYQKWALAHLIRDVLPPVESFQQVLELLSQNLGLKQFPSLVEKVKLIFQTFRPSSRFLQTMIQTDFFSLRLWEKTTLTPKQIPISSDYPQVEVLKVDPTNKQDSTLHFIHHTIEEGVIIDNAGLILIAPFFSHLFQQVDLYRDESFISEGHQERAILLSQFLVTQQNVIDESNLLLNKILCGWPIENSLATYFDPSDKETEEIHALFSSIIEHWNGLGAISHEGFCASFLRRSGKLNLKENHIYLRVERKTHDILMEKLPWNISVIRLSWMKHTIWVEW